MSPEEFGSLSDLGCDRNHLRDIPTLLAELRFLVEQEGAENAHVSISLEVDAFGPGMPAKARWRAYVACHRAFYDGDTLDEAMRKARQAFADRHAEASQ